MDEDNKRLIGDDVSPVMPNKRKTQDLVMLVVFFIFVVSYIGVSSQGLSSGRPNRLHRGVDWMGNFCGTANEKMDLAHAPYLYIADSLDPMDTSVCIEKCPNPEVNPDGADDPNTYVCRYEFKDAPLKEKKSRLGHDCWHAVRSRAYLGVCYPNTNTSISSYPVLSSSSSSSLRGTLNDIFVARTSTIIGGGIFAALCAYMWVALCRVSAKYSAIGSVVIAHLALVGLIVLADVDGHQYLDRLSEMAPKLDEEVEMAESMINVSGFFIAVLVTLFLSTILLRNDLIRGIAVISETSKVHPGLLDLIPLTFSGLHIVSFLFLLCGISSIASVNIVRANMQEEKHNSYMVLGSGDSSKIVFCIITQLWVHGVFHYTCVMIAIASGSLYVFRKAATSPAMRPSVLSALRLVIPSQLGSIAISSLVLAPFEPLALLVLKVGQQLYTTRPLRYMTTGPYTNMALFGMPFTTSVTGHANMIRGMDAHTLVLSTNVVFFFATCMVTSLSMLVAWPSLAEQATGDAVLSSIGLPLFLVAFLSSTVARTIITLLSSGVEASVFCAVAEVSFESAHPKSNANMMLMVSGKKNPGTGGGPGGRGRGASEAANRITYDPRDKDQATRRFVVEAATNSAPEEETVDSAKRDAAALELAMAEDRTLPTTPLVSNAASGGLPVPDIDLNHDQSSAQP